MTEEQKFKLVVAYDRYRNQYSLVEHNRTSEEAQRFLDRWTPHLREGHSFIMLDQTRRHETEKAQGCRACRATVARSDRLEPQAKFVRRKNDATES